MLGLMNTILKYPQKTSTLPVINYFINTLEVIIINSIFLSWFNVNFILRPLHFLIQQLSHMKLSYLIMKKIGFNLLDDEDFTIPYIIDTILNAPDGHKLTTQAKKNVWIIDINGEDTITSQVTLDDVQCHHTPRGK